MRTAVRLLVVALALLTGGAGWAQESQSWLGAQFQDVSKQEAEQLGWEAPRGAKVLTTGRSGPAASAGLLPDDIVISLDGQEVESMAALVAGIGAKAPGTQVRLRVIRSGRERTVSVTLVAPPPDPARTAERRELPFLLIEPGGHMAQIRGLLFTPDGKQLVSAGDDKTIRVWDWQSGRTLRTIRGQVGHGSEGKIFAIALSPDGRLLAVGGYLGSFVGGDKPRVEEEAHKLRLYDFATGKLLGLLKGHTNIVNGLDFSPDGRRLISGSADRSAIIWDVERRTPLHHLRGHKEEVYAVGFTPDGERVVTGSYDTTLKLWSVRDGGEITTLRGHKGKVSRLAVSPTDGTIASGSLEAEIRLWSGTTGMPIRGWIQPGSNPGSLTYGPDGRTLLSGAGSYGTGYDLHVWDAPNAKELLSYRKHRNIVIATAISPDGRLAATAGGSNQEIDIWDIQTGKERRVLQGTGAPRWAAAFSADGRRIAWGNTWRTHTSAASNPLEFQLRLPAVGQSLGEPERVTGDAASAFVRARTADGAYSLAHRSGGGYGYSEAVLDFKKDGQTVASVVRGSSDGYRHHTYAFTPDGQTVISGSGSGVIAAYTVDGKRLGDFIGHYGDVWSVTPSPDGKLLISGSADQTVRVWNLKTRELIVTLFHGVDGEWVMWTPQGYYTGSPGADKMVGWQINKGPENASDFVGAEQLRQHLHRPDIVEKAIVLASAEEAMRQAPGTSFKLADLLSRPVPRFRIVSPLDGSAVRQGGRTAVRIAIDATPDPVRLIRVQVNGRQVAEETPAIGSGGFGTGERVLSVPLAKGVNDLRVTLANVIGEKTETLTLIHDSDGDLDRRGTLHILAIGVNDYKGLGNVCGDTGKESCDLKSAGADARRFVEAVERRLGPGHERINKRVLVNGGDPRDSPTAANITDAVELLRLAKETDTVVLFVAGHGSNEGPDYRFLATDAAWVGRALRGSTVVPWQTLQGAVEAAKGRRILFIDTCHSGNAYNQRLGNAAYHANIVAYTAARFDQLAMEDASLGHGLFTFAVVEGLEGKAVAAPKDEISTKSLAEYIVGRVGTLAKALNGEQEPQYFRGRDAQDFVLTHR